MKRSLIFSILIAATPACTKPGVEGPDKQFAGTLSGAITGAGTGAVTGFQVGASTGAAAWAGAGIGAVAGGVQGAMQDNLEQQMLKTAAKLNNERDRTVAQEILTDHMQKRLQLHPARDIYPADMFFYGDQSSIKKNAEALVREIAILNKERLPYSRFVITSYVKSSDKESSYAKHLSEQRAKVLGNLLVRNGLEPRRIETRGMIVDAPVLIDPGDKVTRYNQAIEFSLVDK